MLLSSLMLSSTDISSSVLSIMTCLSADMVYSGFGACREFMLMLLTRMLLGLKYGVYGSSLGLTSGTLLIRLGQFEQELVFD
jgi:hypothetical protein